jgi:hypothetical protein
MSSETHYEVKIEETIIETRVVRVPKSEVKSAQDAANKAYEAWVLQGRCEQETKFEVEDRTYEVDGEIYDVEADI